MRRVFHQKGAPSQYQSYWHPLHGWLAGKMPPYMFGRGWRKFRKHRFETT